MEDRYLILIDKIREFVSLIETDESLLKAREDYYRGIQILLSPLIYKPTFMFIGINPGAGYFNYKKNVCRFNALKHFEYIGQNYQLARETRKLIALAQLEKEFKNSVKTNCFFFATSTASDLNCFLRLVNKQHAVYKMSRQWLTKLIDIVQPKMIICEGKGAYEYLLGSTNSSYLKGQYRDIPVIGYRRNRSWIRDKKETAELIKEVYLQTHHAHEDVLCRVI